MKKEINIHQTIYELYIQYPEIITIMSELGFDNISKPGMLQTAGRIVTLPKGCRIKGIPLEKVITAFELHGFSIKE